MDLFNFSFFIGIFSPIFYPILNLRWKLIRQAVWMLLNMQRSNDVMSRLTSTKSTSDHYRPPMKLREGNVFTGVRVSLVPGPFPGPWSHVLSWGKVSLVPCPFWRWVYPTPLGIPYPLNTLLPPRRSDMGP